LSKQDSLKALEKAVVAVIRIKDTELAKLVSTEAINAGIKFIELTLSIDNAAGLIAELKKEFPQAQIGAGTVLSIEDCKSVLDAGADFVVAPCVNPEVIKMCNEKDVLCLPGTATPTEVYNCYTLGCEIVKIFPGETLGTAFIKNVKAPMPFVKYMPSGGVDLDNIKKWFDAGAYAVSVGSALYSGVTKDNIQEVGKRAKEYLATLH